ncbi:MAG: hypothetical protein M3O61_12510 [Gemmatimonadota bacterium]|nr:hypothetical protein [Gemmatimonadota bacterium]
MSLIAPLFDDLNDHLSEEIRRELVLQCIARMLASLRTVFPNAATGQLAVRTGSLLDILSVHQEPPGLPTNPPSPSEVFAQWREVLEPVDSSLTPSILAGLQAALISPDLAESERIIRYEFIALREVLGDEVHEQLRLTLEDDMIDATDRYNSINARTLSYSPSWALLDKDLNDESINEFSLRLHHGPEVNPDDVAALLGRFLSALNQAHIAGGGSGFVVRRATVGEYEPSAADVLT